MPAFWNPWEKDQSWGAESPYVNWWRVSPPPEFSEEKSQDRATDPAFTYFQHPFGLSLSGFLEGAGARLNLATLNHIGNFNADLGPLMGDDFGEVVPMPGNVINAGFKAHLKANGDEWMPPEDMLPVVAPDTVIVGIIDSGIPIGGSRLRDRRGKTRVLAAWQQGAARPAAGGQAHLPCGVELYRDGIDALIEAHTAGGLFLSDDFNRAAGLVDMRNPLGVRVLAGRLAHGAMVADLAAGSDPASSDDRVKLITVNLPNLATLNSSGIFLDYFTILGVKRIVDLADAIHAKSRAQATEADKGKWAEDGLPIVINLSFGKNAGSKDGRDPFSASITTINSARLKEGKRPIVVITPVGNHNLEQANAQFTLAAGGEDEIALRIAPEDQTPNYLEIWSDRIPLDPGQVLGEVRPPLEIAVTPPGAAAEAFDGGSHRWLRKTVGDVARLYCELHRGPEGNDYRICYLLCVAPSLRHSSLERPIAPAGAWAVRLRNRSESQLRVFLGAQTDHATRAHSRIGRNPYLERPDYRKHHLTSGRLLDSCDDGMDFPGGIPDTEAILRRHGSINATAMGEDVIAVAGYRRSDGRPADYSATGHGFKVGVRGRAAPSFALPTDTSPALFGLLGAGAADGSVVAMRGTSFAAAAATRLAVDLLLIDPEHPGRISDKLNDAAAAAEAHLNARMEPACRTKIGAGRLHSTPQRPISRREA